MAVEAKQRPLGITVLAVLSGIACLVAVYHTLQFLHILPFRVGEFKFFGADIWGALSWGIMALIYLWLLKMLWAVDPRGWLFLAAISVINIVLAVLSVMGQSTWDAMAASLLVNAIILVYVLLPGTKKAFGVQ